MVTINPACSQRSNTKEQSEELNFHGHNKFSSQKSNTKNKQSEELNSYGHSSQRSNTEIAAKCLRPQQIQQSKIKH